ncbi:MAG: autotransporter-associated beta strand repeat-containing protein [Opitutaceae bacterium]|jgi:autotransporter-associated beta strand protein|nr:autotransporter-associated beta strand repeat-containing protein [Opitutaceae bacterium]
MKTTTRSRHLPLAALTAIALATTSLVPAPSRAETFTWSPDGGGDWDTATNWTQNAVPDAADADVTVTTTESGSTILLGNASTTVHNLSATTNGGTTLNFASANTSGSYALNITGTLKKNNGSSTIAFYNYNAGRNLNLTVNTLDFAANGNFYFGRSDGGRQINTLAIGALNMGYNGNTTNNLGFNVAANYTLGDVTLGGSNTKNVYLISNSSTGAGYSRTATIKSLTQTSGAAATIHGSQRAASTGANTATLKIDTDAATAFTATTILADGTGGTLALLKTGAGQQTLSGALAHTGGTTVEQGTLVLTGSLAATGDLTIANGATLVAGTALTLHDAALESGAILGFDLGADAKLNLAGNLTLQGDTTSNPVSLVIDFRNTGIAGNSYNGLLSVAGTNAFSNANATVTYINFGAEGLSGTLGMDELTGGFVIGTAIPEPAILAPVLGTLALLASIVVRRRIHALRA